MKKFASLMLAGALCAGLATTAFADSYTYTYTYTDEETTIKLIFNDVTITEETLEFAEIEGDGTYLEEVVMVTVTPGSSIMAEEEGEGILLSVVERYENGYEYTPGDDYFTDGTIDDKDHRFYWDGKYQDIIYALGTDPATGKHAFLKMWDGTETPAASETPTTTPDSYIAVKYDTWGQIALNNYGSYGAWQQLYKANNYAKLTEGTVINLPETLGKYTRIGAPVAKEGESLYTVKAGDTLGTIAAAKYGDLMQYKAIFERNADRLKNANTIYEGQVIVLPVIQ